MKRWLLGISVVVCALALLVTGGWWVWRAYYSAEQFREAVEGGDFGRAERLAGWGADMNLWMQHDAASGLEPAQVPPSGVPGTGHEDHECTYDATGEDSNTATR